MGTNLINLRVRNLQNDLNSVLNEFSDVPIEMQRIIVSGILDQLTTAADLVTKHEMAEYLKDKEEVKDNV